MVKAVLLLLLLFGTLNYHPVHVSVASVDHVPDKDEFSVFIKFFSDDLEDDCQLMWQDTTLIVYDENWMPDSDIINKYIESRFIFIADNNKLDFTVTDIEGDKEEVRVYLVYRFEGDVSSFRIINTVMTDLFPDQTNLLIFRMDGFEQGYIFTPEITEQIIKP